MSDFIILGFLFLKWVFRFRFEQQFTINSMDANHFRFDHNSMFEFGTEISSTCHNSVMFSFGIPQLKTQPNTWCKVRPAHIFDDSHFLEQMIKRHISFMSFIIDTCAEASQKKRHKNKRKLAKKTASTPIQERDGSSNSTKNIKGIFNGMICALGPKKKTSKTSFPHKWAI